MQVNLVQNPKKKQTIIYFSNTWDHEKQQVLRCGLSGGNWLMYNNLFNHLKEAPTPACPPPTHTRYLSGEEYQ